MENIFDNIHNKNAQRGELILKAFGREETFEKAGEGSRGGKVIGHTKSGKPVYAHDNHEDYLRTAHGWHPGDVAGSEKTRKAAHKQSEKFREDHKDFTKEDHKDAIKAHQKAAKEARKKDGRSTFKKRNWESDYHDYMTNEHITASWKKDK